MAGTGQRVVVTGGAGFIGTHLCRQLQRAPAVDTVVVLDDLSGGDGSALPPQVRLVRGSVLDPQAVAAVLTGADAVVHLAANSSVRASMADPLGTYRLNAEGTAQVLEAARRAGVRSAVLASSAAVYGNPGGERPGVPCSPYGASKAAAETYALTASAAYGLPVLALRLFNVFGPGQRTGGGDGAVVPTLLAAAARGEPLTIEGDGAQRRDFVHVTDVCRLITQAVCRGVSHPAPVDVGTGAGTSIAALVALLERCWGAPLPCRHRPARPGDVRDSRADVRTLRELFPSFAPTRLPEALAATVTAYRRAAAAPSRSVPAAAASAG